MFIWRFAQQSFSEGQGGEGVEGGEGGGGVEGGACSLRAQRVHTQQQVSSGLQQPVSTSDKNISGFAKMVNQNFYAKRVILWHIFEILG